MSYVDGSTLYINRLGPNKNSHTGSRRYLIKTKLEQNSTKPVSLFVAANLAIPAAPARFGGQPYIYPSGNLSPLISDNAVIDIICAIPSFWSEDIFPLMIIEHYMDSRVLA
ncbi:MAG: hypothetical protein HKP12_13155 [Gammaproteobacteria bacterium]|nr:hypothetical protein [Gammaproteobacteria bacterium]